MIYGSRITNCNFTNSDIGRVDFTDVIFENCDFSNVKMEHGSLHRVIFKNCRMTGTYLKQMRLGHTSFCEVKANFVSFIDSKMDKLLFDTCQLEHGAFYESTLKQITLKP